MRSLIRFNFGRNGPSGSGFGGAGIPIRVEGGFLFPLLLLTRGCKGCRRKRRCRGNGGTRNRSGELGRCRPSRHILVVPFQGQSLCGHVFGKFLVRYRSSPCCFRPRGRGCVSKIRVITSPRRTASTTSFPPG